MRTGTGHNSDRLPTVVKAHIGVQNVLQRLLCLVLRFLTIRSACVRLSFLARWTREDNGQTKFTFTFIIRKTSRTAVADH